MERSTQKDPQWGIATWKVLKEEGLQEIKGHKYELCYKYQFYF